MLLKNVELNPKALDSMGIPVKLVRGVIKEIEINFGSSLVRSLLGKKKIDVTISSVFIVAKSKVAMDVDRAKKELAKLAVLDAHKLFREQVHTYQQLVLFELCCCLLYILYLYSRT